MTLVLSLIPSFCGGNKQRRLKGAQAKVIYSEPAIARGSHCPWVWHRLKAPRGVGKVLVKQSEGFRYVSTGGYWLWKAGGKITRRWVFCLIFLVFFFFLEEQFWLSLVGPQLEENIGNLKVIDQALTIWGQLQPGYGLVFGTGCWTLSVQVVFSYVIWPLPACVMSLTVNVIAILHVAQAQTVVPAKYFYCTHLIYFTFLNCIHLYQFYSSELQNLYTLPTATPCSRRSLCLC